MQAVVCPFSEHTIAQTIAVMSNFCRATRKIPYLVAVVEGTSAERDAWRQVAIDYLTAKAEHRNVNLAGQPAIKGEESDSPYDYAD